MIGVGQQPLLEELCDRLWELAPSTLLGSNGGRERGRSNDRRWRRRDNRTTSGAITMIPHRGHIRVRIVGSRRRRRIAALVAHGRGRRRSRVRSNVNPLVIRRRIDMQLRTPRMMVDGGKVVGRRLVVRRGVMMMVMSYLLVLMRPLRRTSCRRCIRGLRGRWTGQIMDGREDNGAGGAIRHIHLLRWFVVGRRICSSGR